MDLESRVPRGTVLVAAGATLTVSLASTAGILGYLLYELYDAGNGLTAVLLGLSAAASLGAATSVSLLVLNCARRTSARSPARDGAVEVTRRDPLTGLLNHHAVVEELHRLPELPGNHALLMTDIDGLKRINDLYGHSVGDQVLIAVAAGLAQPGALIARYGGDEFVSILKNTGRREAEAYRDRVMQSLHDAGIRDSITGDRIEIKASIGVAMFPEDAPRIENLLSFSDDAMYAVKRRRRLASDANRYELNIDRLTSILSAFAPLLSGSEALGDKMNALARRLLNGTGAEGIVVVLWSQRETAPIARTALASADQLMEHRLNKYFESVSYDERPTWQQLQQSGRPIVVRNLQEDPRFVESDREMARATGMCSLLLLPLNEPEGIIGALYVGSARQDAFGPADVQFFAAVAEHLRAVIRTSYLLEEIQRSAARLAEEHEATVMRLAAAAEAHDPAVGPHQSRVRQISELLARELGSSPAEAHQLGLAAALHDVGKLYVPESLLASTKVLSPAQKREFQKHTYLGSQFLDAPGTELASIVAHSHHERWDGAGYPEGLQGEEIPMAARITSVADVLDAMTHDRSYQAHIGLAAAIEEISAESGKQFSPQVVGALLALYKRGALDSLLAPEAGDAEKAA